MYIDNKITKLRCLAILIVVFGHSIIIYDPQWGLYTTNNKVEVLIWIKRVINAIQMPLFLFISGFCFKLSVKKHDYINRHNVISGICGKAKRLLIPFVFVAVLYMIPIRYLCNYAPWENIKYIQILVNVFLGFDCAHLWFLPTLFLIFSFSFVFFPYINTKKIEIMILLFSFIGVLFANRVPSILFLQCFVTSFYWFYLGYEGCEYKSCIERICNTKISVLSSVISGMIVIFTIFEKVITNGLVVSSIQNIAVSILILNLYNTISNRKCSRLVQFISDESMGIYLLHSPLVYFTYAYYSDGLPIVVVILNFLIGGLIATFLTFVIKNSRLKWILGLG